MPEMGQTEKNSVRPNVFRFALELGHCSTQSACLNGASALNRCRATIVWGTWGLLRDSMAMSLSAVPAGIDPGAVRGYLEKCKGVTQVHDLHIWPMSTTEVALTCHIVIPAGQPGDAYLMGIAHYLKEKFGIQHATLQVETDPSSACALAPDHVV